MLDAFILRCYVFVQIECSFGVNCMTYISLSAGNIEACKDFFRTIYGFIYQLGTYLKPHVSIHSSR